MRCAEFEYLAEGHRRRRWLERAAIERENRALRALVAQQPGWKQPAEFKVARRRPLTQELLAQFNGHPLPVAQVAARFEDRTPQQIRAAIVNLEQSGLLKRVARGVYQKG
jgi:predicted Rossmann fold nucleotide-binding protein DprA/Smf involved in DNA uptake